MTQIIRLKYVIILDNYVMFTFGNSILIYNFGDVQS